MSELQELQEKLRIARVYLQEYFENSLGPVLENRFVLFFSDLDKASVHWTTGGKPVIYYRLAFLPDRMEWRGRRVSGEKVEAIPVRKEVEG